MTAHRTATPHQGVAAPAARSCRLPLAAMVAVVLALLLSGAPSLPRSEPDGSGDVSPGPWRARVAWAQTVPRVGTVLSEVTTAGGAVSASNVSVLVPPGAVPRGASFFLTIVPQPAEALPSPPAGLQPGGRPFSVAIQSAAGQPAALSLPLEVRVPFAATQPALPRLYTLFERRWVAIPTEVEGREVVGSLPAAGGVVALFLRPVPAELPRTGGAAVEPAPPATHALPPGAGASALSLTLLALAAAAGFAASARP